MQLYLLKFEMSVAKKTASTKPLKLSLRRKKDNAVIENTPTPSINPQLPSHTDKPRSKRSRFSLLLERVATPSPERQSKEITPPQMPEVCKGLSISDDNDFKRPIEPVITRRKQDLQRE